MEFRKEDIQVLRTKSRATSQVTLDMDYNVPDVKPDIGRMIQNKGEVTVEEVRLNDGHAFVKGKLQADVLYVGEEDGRVYSLSAGVPVEETLNLDGIVNGDKLCLKWEIEDLSIHIIHSRKMNIRAVITFYASVDELTGIRLPVAADDENISVKKKQMCLLSLAVHKKDTLRLKEEVELVSNKPDIAELLWYTIEIRGLDLRPEEQKVKAKGELFIFVLYTGGDEGSTLQWLEHTIPFNGEAECTGCTSEMIPNLEASVISQSLEVRPDADGEERKLQADVVLELDMKLYREEEHDVIMDAYTPFRQYQTKGRPEMLESLLIRNFSRCRLSDRVTIRETQGKILQICHSDGKIKIDEERIVENGIEVTGVVELRALYVVSDDEMPFYAAETAIPFRHTIEVPEIGPDCRYELQSSIDQLSTTMPDSSDIEAKVVLNLNALVFRRRKEMVMQYVEEKDRDPEELQKLPGITCYFVKPGDTLWDIAKKFYTTTDKIRELNELKTETLTPMQQLLVERV